MTRYVSRWGEYGERPVPRPENRDLFGSFTLTETILVACSTGAAWALVSSISRIGEFSPECVAAEWIEGATGPDVGARFEGTKTFRHLPDGLSGIRAQADADPERAPAIVASRAKDLRRGMRATLRAMRRVLEGSG